MLAFAGDGPGRHDRRHGARHAPNQWHHGAPAQAQSFQKPIAQKAHARHVTGRFQCARQAEQNHDLRHKHNNARDAVQNPVEQQPFPPTLGHGTVCGLVQPPKRAVYSIHGRLGPRVHCLENTEEYQSQDGVSPDRVGQDAVDARRTLRGFFPREFGSIGDERFGVVADVLHAPASLFQLQGSRRFLKFRTRCFKCLGLSVVQPNGQVTGTQVPGELRFCGTWKVGFQGVEGGAPCSRSNPVVVVGAHPRCSLCQCGVQPVLSFLLEVEGEGGNAQPGFHGFEPHVSGIGPVDDDGCRKAHLQNLQRQEEAAADVGAVEDNPHGIGLQLGVEQFPLGDALIICLGEQAVGAGQVHELHTGLALPRSLVPLDGDARHVANLGSSPGEAVEERGFATIGVADERDFHGSNFGVSKAASYPTIGGFSGAPTIGPDLGVSGCCLGRATLRSAGWIGRWRSIRCRFSPRLPPVRLW